MSNVANFYVGKWLKPLFLLNLGSLKDLFQMTLNKQIIFQTTPQPILFQRDCFLLYIKPYAKLQAKYKSRYNSESYKS